MAILMMRGEILRKERSILYQTPKKVLLKDKIALMMPTPTRSVSKTPKSVFKRGNCVFSRTLVFNAGL